MGGAGIRVWAVKRTFILLAAALRAAPDSVWQTFGTKRDGTLRQWTEWDFVPARPSEHKDARRGCRAGSVAPTRRGCGFILLASNVVSAQRALARGEELRTARRKRLRWHVYALSGRMSHTGNALKLRLHAGLAAIRQQVWEVFALPTQATYSG